ncbi:hypothetical protein IM774_12565 [Erysipelotrichaceae bacterium RD49]|nr:hypothetical protein [Erysipelotrichaceae bacterium RD49]
MKHTAETTTLKSRKYTKTCKFVAMAMSLSAAAIVGYSVMKPAPASVEAYAYTSENKVAVVANKQKVEKIDIEEPEQPAAAIQENQESSEAAVEEVKAALAEAPAAAVVEAPAPVQPAEPQTAPAPVEAMPMESISPEQPAAQPVNETFEAFEEVQPVVVEPETPAQTLQPTVIEQSAPSQTTQTIVEQSAPVETPAPAQPASLIGSDGIWHITYVPAWGAGSAPADGSIGIWADGWFIAHSGMINGDTIASLPQYVEVDGQVYTMTDTWVSGDSVDTNEIARARANNGIVFQTCITETTNRLVHYEPVNGAGYAYNFTSFPYTAQDAVIFGM